MAKYSVNGVEVVDDTGQVDWTRFKNKPTLVNGANGTTRNETIGSGSISALTFYLEDDGTGKARLVRRVTLVNCDCNCDCFC